MVYPPRKEFHAHDEEIRRDGIPLFNTPVGVEKSVLSSLMRIEMKEVEIQDIMREVSLGECYKSEEPV